MNNLTLFEIASQYRADVAVLESLDTDEQTFKDTLESLSGDLELKATNIGIFAKNLTATVEAIKNAEDQLASRRSSLEKKVESIKNYLLVNMEACGISKIDSPHLQIAIKKNPQSVVVESEVDIPMEFYNPVLPPPPKLDKSRLKEALKAGTDISGVRLEQKNRIEIK